MRRLTRRGRTGRRGRLRGVQNSGKLRLSAVSGFEAACLDALGKTLGLPVHALLGGKVRDSVEYSAYLFYRWAEHPEGGEPDGRLGAAPDPAGVVARHSASPAPTASPPSNPRAVSSSPNRRSPPSARRLEDDGTMRERDDAAAMRKAEPEWLTPSVPRW